MLKSHKNLDPLQKKTILLIETLAEKSGIPTECFGLTGSLLLGIHNPKFSDIDLTIHGNSYSKTIRKLISRLYIEENEFIRMNEHEAKDWKNRKIKQFNLTIENVNILYERKWNMGYFDGTRFSIHPIRADSEIKNDYGSKKFISEGEITIRAKIVDDEEGLFLPCCYKISQVEVLKGPRVADIHEIVSYEGLYSSIGKKNEILICKGRLERVLPKKGEEYFRILLGSSKSSKNYLFPQIKEKKKLISAK